MARGEHGHRHRGAAGVVELGEVGGQGRVIEPAAVEPVVKPAEGASVGAAGVVALRGVDQRVPTRFVQKYTLRARLEPSGSHKAVEGGTGHAGDLGDGGLGDAQLEEAPDVVLLAVEP